MEKESSANCGGLVLILLEQKTVDYIAFDVKHSKCSILFCSHWFHIV